MRKWAGGRGRESIGDQGGQRVESGALDGEEVPYVVCRI